MKPSMNAGNNKMDLIVKTNRLNTAIQNLTLAEIRLVQLAIITPVRDKPHCNSLILFTMLLPVPAEACF